MPNLNINTLVYHITHIDNLDGIIQSNGLWCDRERNRQGFESINIAYNELKERRMVTSVRVYEGKTLGDFVPFYFTNRSPMLFAIHKGTVESYPGTQNEIIYLVSTVKNLMNCRRRWCFTNGHAVEALSEYFTDISDLVRIDSEVIESWSWHKKENDPDRKRRKQAEFLVEDSVPLDVFTEIGVINEENKRKVENILCRFKKEITVSLHEKWYY
jgi:hypothetical protein